MKNNTEDTNMELIIQHIKHTNTTMENQIVAFNALHTAVLGFNTTIDEKFDDHISNCPFRTAEKKLTEDTVKFKLLKRDSLPAKAIKKIKLDKIPTPIWVIIIVIITHILSLLFGIDSKPILASLGL